MLFSILFLIIKNQQGAMLLLTALTLPLLLGLTSVAVDCGSLYLEKSRLQNAADAASNTYKHMRLVPDEQAYLFDQNMQDHINRLRARRSIYIPDQSLDGNLSKTNHGQIPRQVSQFDPEIDLSQWDGQIVELRYYSNKFKLTRPLSHLTYVIVDGGDSIVFDVSNDYTNNNLVLIYSPTDTEYSTTDAETYNSDGKDGNRADPVYKTKKAKISHLAKSSIKFINSDPSGQSHTFSGAIYAPFGEVDFAMLRSFRIKPTKGKPGSLQRFLKSERSHGFILCREIRSRRWYSTPPATKNSSASRRSFPTHSP
ncbi:Tad domain-containing protein [Selenomonas ruminis]|uniref:Tad domain-containing protein n=1 Tax=Selenomonas ruminis TaxID=2593411 RepID=UPI001654D871|nr:Tad domain-containing protein [Selenomonas sp. mPRGC5]